MVGTDTVLIVRPCVNVLKTLLILTIKVFVEMDWVRVLRIEVSLDVMLDMVMDWVRVLKRFLIPDITVFDDIA